MAAPTFSVQGGNLANPANGPIPGSSGGMVWDPNLNGPGGVGGWVTPAQPNSPGAVFGAGIGSTGYYYPPGTAPQTTPQNPVQNFYMPPAQATPSVTPPPPQDIGTYNIKGVGSENIFETPQGAAYYTNASGQNMLLNPQQTQKLGLPQVVGYNSSGQPYYYQNPAYQPTPEKSALQQLYKTDPGLKPVINNLQSYYQGLAKSTRTGNLDPATLNQIQQASRAAQVARGNALGTSQAAQEAMTTGLTGWQMGQTNAQNVSSYLNSGTSPAAMGARSLGDIINQGQSANSGTPFSSTYNPAQTFTYSNPNAGNNFSTGANNWYNSMNQQYLGSGAAGTGSNPGAGALSGALSGAGTGASIGSFFGPYGTLIGAGVGAIGGGATGYATQSCWVAREIYGADNPKWRVFRHWMLNEAPDRFRKAYLANGPGYAKHISDKPELKAQIKSFMDKVIRQYAIRQYAN